MGVTFTGEGVINADVILVSSLGVGGGRGGLLDAEAEAAVGECGDLQHDLAHARAQVDELVLGADGLDVVEDLADELERRLAVDLGREGLVVVELVGVLDGLVVALGQDVLQVGTVHAGSRGGSGGGSFGGPFGAPTFLKM